MPTAATVLQVYALDTTIGISHVIDIAMPPTAVAPTPPSQSAVPGTGTPPSPTPATTTWTEGASFTLGQVVRWKGANYVCVQPHTAWRGAGWQPDAPSVINVLWKPQR